TRFSRDWSSDVCSSDLNLQGRRIAVWGLAFKANTDDIREASSLDNIRALLNKGAEIVAYDAIAEDNVRRLLGDQIEYAADMYSEIGRASGRGGRARTVG